jgi:hypothetical protein
MLLQLSLEPRKLLTYRGTLKPYQALYMMGNLNRPGSILDLLSCFVEAIN